MILSGWHDWVNSIDSENAKKVNEIEGFRKMVDEIEGFPKKINNTSGWLIGLIESFELFLWVDWVGSYVLSNMLNWLIYASYTDSWWLNQYIFTYSVIAWIDLAWVVYKSKFSTHLSERDSLNSAVRSTRLAQTQHFKYFGFTTLLRGQSTSR